MDDHAGLISVLILISVFIGLFFLVAQDESNWSQYSKAHHCFVTGHSEPTTGVGVSGKGQVVVTSNPGQTIYACDGGEIIIR